jgi:predicted CXXCH cytochrome family protein
MRFVTLPRAAALFAVVVGVTACKEIVYRDRALFEEPLAAAGGFLGYANSAQHQTVCGQCHVSFQGRWEETAHADAWSTLQSSPGNQASCNGCHTTNSRGNPAQGEQAGFLGHADKRYYDVQCEACHGPGLTHVRSPTRDNRPLASIAAGPDLSYGCGECHSGAHQPFVEQWSQSAHANIRSTGASPVTNVNCQSCHRGQNALVQLGVRSEYVERSAAAHQPITCTVCHDPHDRTNPNQLRLPIDVYSEEGNLCMRCHQRRATPVTNTASGPHSPEGPLLLGVAGWFPPNLQFQPGEVVASHGSEANPRLCAGCHVNKYEIRDQLTGEFQFRSTGHTFEAIPCVDGQGVPSGSHECGLAQRSFLACATSGCHASQQIARSRLELVRDEIGSLAAALQGMEAQVPAGEFNANDNRYTTAEGSRFNRQLAQVKGSEVHNPVLVKALLRASIRQMNLSYGIPLPPAFNVSPELDLVW